MNPLAISRLSAYYWRLRGQSLMDLMATVSGPSFKPHEHKGGLQCVRTDNVKIAYFGAIAGAVRDYIEAATSGQTPAAVAPLTEELKRCCAFEFNALASDDHIEFSAANQRERLLTDCNTLAVNAYHWTYQVLNGRDGKEEILGRLSAPSVVAELKKHAQLATDNWPATVDMTIYLAAIDQHALKIPEIVEQCKRRFVLQPPPIPSPKMHLNGRNAKKEKYRVCSVVVYLHALQVRMPSGYSNMWTNSSQVQ